MVKSRDTSVITMLTQLAEATGPNRTIAPMIIPPDGGWGWVIVMVGLLSSCIVDGVEYCFYLYREPMSGELNTKQSEISFLASLNTGFYFFGAVLGCSFGNHFGFRLTMIIGGIVTSLSYMSGYILHEIIEYYILVGVLAGIGSGFVSMSGLLPPGFYFDKKRSIAMGIVSCGSGLGGIVMPSAVNLCMQHYGWRISYLFEGGIAALTIILGILILPLKPVMVVIDGEPSSTSLKREDSADLDLSAFRIHLKLPPDAFSLASTHRSAAGETAYSAHPTIAQMTDDMNTINIKVNNDNSNNSILTRLQEMTLSRYTSQVLPPSASNIRIIQETVLKKRLPWYKCGCCRSKTVSLPPRPLMRNDLYYTGSLWRLPEYSGRDRDLEYHMNVTKVPTYYQTVQDITRTYSLWCCNNVCTGLRYLIDYTMFKSLAFDCLALCGFGTYIAFYLPYLFCKVHLEQQGAGSQASNLVPFIGLGTMCGRFFSGLIITALPRVDARMVASVTTLISSIAITVMVLNNNLYFKGACLFTFGFTIGFYAPLRCLIIVDYFGLEKLTSASGVLILCVAVASFLGPIIAENAMQYTRNADAPFYVSGISLFFACVVLFPMKRISKWEKKRAQRRKNVERTQT